MKTRVLVVCSAMIGALMPALASANVIIDWNNLLLQAVKDTSTNPPNASRAMAMTSTAVFDAVNSIEGHFKPYHFMGSAAGASGEAAAAQAAHNVMVHLFPARAVDLGIALSTSLAGLPDSGKAAGVALGAAAAQSIIDLRSDDDGSGTTVPYLPGSKPGEWRPTPPDHEPALLPNWPTVTPFAMTSGEQFRASGPPALTSKAYTDAFNEVKLLGAANSTKRTDDQTDIARFWADGAGTITPPGHWNQIAQSVVQPPGKLSLVEEARLFALLNIAEADAAILCWDTKYSSNFWRPITAIREADTDGNDLTEQDADWKPLLTTPNFPSYTSGHASFSGAAAAVLAGLTGSDSFTFTAKAHNSVAVADRTFFSFSQAAGEAADSRLYGGIHFDFDNADGLAAGVALGQYVLNSQLQPVPEPATWALYGLGMLTIVGLRLVRSPALR